MWFPGSKERLKKMRSSGGCVACMRDEGVINSLQLLIDQVSGWLKIYN